MSGDSTDITLNGKTQHFDSAQTAHVVDGKVTIEPSGDFVEGAVVGTDELVWSAVDNVETRATLSDRGEFSLTPFEGRTIGMSIGGKMDCAVQVNGDCVIQGDGSHLYTNHGWEQRAADYAVGFGLGTAMATALFIILVRAFVVPKRQRVVGPTESVR